MVTASSIARMMSGRTSEAPAVKRSRPSEK
jgi:hypothetical protein